MFDDSYSTTRIALGVTFLAILAVGLAGAGAALQPADDAAFSDDATFEDHIDDGGNDCDRYGTYCDISAAFDGDATFEDHIDNGGNDCFRTGTYCSVDS